MVGYGRLWSAMVASLDSAFAVVYTYFTDNRPYGGQLPAPMERCNNELSIYIVRANRSPSMNGRREPYAKAGHRENHAGSEPATRSP